MSRAGADLDKYGRHEHDLIVNRTPKNDPLRSLTKHDIRLNFTYGSQFTGLVFLVCSGPEDWAGEVWNWVETPE